MADLQSVIAVIDIGSNSIRLQISKILDNTYKVTEEYKETLRIGDNVYRTGILSPEAVETVVSVLSKMKTMMDSNKTERYRAVATAPFREASNADNAVKIIKERTGIDVEIISGIEEARLMYIAASSFFQLSQSSTLLVDMGGGSTEFSLAADGKLKFSESTPLGCSKLTYEFFKNDPVKPKEIDALKNHIHKTIDSFLPENGVDKLICSGGTINNISAIYNKRGNLSDSAVKFVDSVFSKHFINELAGKSVAERLKINGLEPARADMILSASLLVQILIKRYRLGGFYTLSGGLRSGLTIDLINKMGIQLPFQSAPCNDVRYGRLIETGKKYSFEETHALQVTMIAKKIFNGLYQYLKLDARDWNILEAAALLHDVGQYIAYSRHHKHSHYLIMNTELAEYSEREKTIIANVARYHRRGLPKSDHIDFMRLSALDRELVTKLSAILRIADGLDRSHSSFIKDLWVKVKDNTIEFGVTASEDIAAERSGFYKKKDLLQLITGKEALLL